MPLLQSKGLRLLIPCTLLVVASLVRFAPTTKIDLPSKDHLGSIVGRWSCIGVVDGMQKQYFDPWVQFATDFHDGLRWRILVPALAHWTHLPLSVYFLLPRIGGILVVFLVAGLVWRETKSEAAALCAAALAATSSAFFVAEDWIRFDPFALIALLVYAFSPGPLVAFACAALGPWIDERFILILPAVAVLRMSRQQKTVIPTLLGLAPYLALRFVFLFFGDLTVERQIRVQHLFCPWFPVGWWEGFRLGWILIAAGVWFVARKYQTLLPVALAAGLALIVWLAYDTSRSVAVLLPFIVTGAVALRARPRLLLACAILNFALPAGHIIADVYFPLTPIWTPPDLGGHPMGRTLGPWVYHD
jgi:hypothetical protein